MSITALDAVGREHTFETASGSVNPIGSGMFDALDLRSRRREHRGQRVVTTQDASVVKRDQRRSAAIRPGETYTL